MRGRKNPDKLPANHLPPCRVCGEASTGFHYGVITCIACKGFFRRSLARNEPYPCTENQLCRIGPCNKRRQLCPKCRYDKCIKVGMSREGCKVGRYSRDKKYEYHKEALEQEKLALRGHKYLSSPSISSSTSTSAIASSSSSSPPQPTSISRSRPNSSYSSDDDNGQYASDNVSSTRTQHHQYLVSSSFTQTNTNDDNSSNDSDDYDNDDPNYHHHDGRDIIDLNVDDIGEEMFEILSVSAFADNEDNTKNENEFGKHLRTDLSNPTSFEMKDVMQVGEIQDQFDDSHLPSKKPKKTFLELQPFSDNNKFQNSPALVTPPCEPLLSRPFMLTNPEAIPISTPLKQPTQHVPEHIIIQPKQLPDSCHRAMELNANTSEDNKLTVNLNFTNFHPSNSNHSTKATQNFSCHHHTQTSCSNSSSINENYIGVDFKTPIGAIDYVPGNAVNANHTDGFPEDLASMECGQYSGVIPAMAAKPSFPPSMDPSTQADYDDKFTSEIYSNSVVDREGFTKDKNNPAHSGFEPRPADVGAAFTKANSNTTSTSTGETYTPSKDTTSFAPTPSSTVTLSHSVISTNSSFLPLHNTQAAPTSSLLSSSPTSQSALPVNTVVETHQDNNTTSSFLGCDNATNKSQLPPENHKINFSVSKLEISSTVEKVNTQNHPESLSEIDHTQNNKPISQPQTDTEIQSVNVNIDNTDTNMDTSNEFSQCNTDSPEKMEEENGIQIVGNERHPKTESTHTTPNQSPPSHSPPAISSISTPQTLSTTQSPSFEHQSKLATLLSHLTPPSSKTQTPPDITARILSVTQIRFQLKSYEKAELIQILQNGYKPRDSTQLSQPKKQFIDPILWTPNMNSQESDPNRFKSLSGCDINIKACKAGDFTYDATEMDNLFEEIIAKHISSYGKPTRMAPADLKKAQDAYWNICLLQEALQGPLEMVEDDCYYRILDSTGIDIDRRKMYLMSYLEYFDNWVVRDIRFFKNLPGFRDLSLHDRTALTKACSSVYGLMKDFRGWDREKNIVIGEEGSTAFCVSKSVRVFPEIFPTMKGLLDYYDHMQAYDPSNEEMVLLKAILVVTPFTYESLEEPDAVKRCYDRYLSCILNLIRKTHGCGPHADERFSQLLAVLDKLTELRATFRTFMLTSVENLLKLIDSESALIFREVFAYFKYDGEIET